MRGTSWDLLPSGGLSTRTTSTCVNSKGPTRGEVPGVRHTTSEDVSEPHFMVEYLLGDGRRGRGSEVGVPCPLQRLSSPRTGVCRQVVRTGSFEGHRDQGPGKTLTRTLERREVPEVCHDKTRVQRVGDVVLQYNFVLLERGRGRSYRIRWEYGFGYRNVHPRNVHPVGLVTCGETPSPFCRTRRKRRCTRRKTGTTGPSKRTFLRLSVGTETSRSDVGPTPRSHSDPETGYPSRAGHR